MRFLDDHDIVPLFVPINIGSARASDIVSLKNWGRCAIVFYGAAGSAGEDPTITVEQSKNVAGSSNKALTFTRVDTKQGAALTSVGVWTEVTQAAANTYTNTDAAEQQKMWVIDIDAASLDKANGFDCLAISIGDAGSVNQIACAFAILSEARYAKSGGVSAIVN